MLDPRVQEIFKRESIAQHTQQWYEVRKGLVTASEVGSITGTNKFKSRRQLLLQKLGCCSEEMSWFGKKATTWGNDHEDLAADRFAELYGKELLYFGLFLHPEHKWIGASPDRITKDGWLLEIKCPISRPVTCNPPGVPFMQDGDHVPPYYRDQMLLLMEVLDLEHAYYMEWRPETTWEPEQLGVTVVHRNRQWFDDVLPKLRSFYDDMMELRKKPRNDLLALFPPAQRATSVRPTRTRAALGYCFHYRPIRGLPSGGPDVFYELGLPVDLDAPAPEEICIEEQPSDPTHDDFIPED